VDPDVDRRQRQRQRARRRPGRAARRPVLERLDDRTLLSTASVAFPAAAEPPPAPASEPPAVLLPPAGLPDRPIVPERDALPRDLDRPPDFISMRFPWRVSATLSGDLAARRPIPKLAESPGPHQDLETAQPTPIHAEFAVDATITSEEGIDFYRVPIAPSTREMNITYQVLGTEDGRPWRDGGPFRVWLLDADRSVIDSWLLDAPTRRLDLNMKALGRPEAGAVFVGVQALGEPTSRIAYTVLFERPGLLPPVFPEVERVPSPVPPGSFEDNNTITAPVLAGAPSVFISSSVDPSGGLEAGSFAAVEASPLASPALSGLFFTVAPRSLPAQAASTSGGLLATGPTVRAADPDDPSQLRGEAQASAIDRSEAESGDAEAQNNAEGDAAAIVRADGAEGSSTQAEPDSNRNGRVRVRVARADRADALEALEPLAIPPAVGGTGAAPLAAASLRDRWPRFDDRSATETSASAWPVAGSSRSTNGGRVVLADRRFETDADAEPTAIDAGADQEPQRASLPVIRTALVASVAIGLSLVVPDLRPDRPLLRRPGRIGSGRSSSPGGGSRWSRVRLPSLSSFSFSLSSKAKRGCSSASPASSPSRRLWSESEPEPVFSDRPAART